MKSPAESGRSAAGCGATYDFVDEMLRRQAGPLQYDYKGDKPMAVFHMLRAIDWLVGVAVSRNEVYVAMFCFMRAVGGVTFAALCLNAIAVSCSGAGRCGASMSHSTV